MQVSTTRLYQQVHILHSRSFRSSTDQLLHLLEVCRWYTSLQSGIGDDKVAALSIEADCDCGLAHGGQVEESLSFQVGSSTGFQSWLIIGPSTPGAPARQPQLREGRFGVLTRSTRRRSQR